MRSTLNAAILFRGKKQNEQRVSEAEERNERRNERRNYFEEIRGTGCTVPYPDD